MVRRPQVSPAMVQADIAQVQATTARRPRPILAMALRTLIRLPRQATMATALVSRAILRAIRLGVVLLPARSRRLRRLRARGAAIRSRALPMINAAAPI